MKPETGFTSKFVIRHGKADDAALLAELGARTFSETFADDNSPANMAAYLSTAFSPEQQGAELADPQSLFLIAETSFSAGGALFQTDETLLHTGKTSSTAIGYAMIRPGNVPTEVTGNKPIELVRLYVSQELLGSGVGAALMQACINEAKQRGYETLWLGVWQNNDRAQEFYRRWDFHEVGTHVFQLGDDPQTDILMQRSL